MTSLLLEKWQVHISPLHLPCPDDLYGLLRIYNTGPDFESIFVCLQEISLTVYEIVKLVIDSETKAMYLRAIAALIHQPRCRRRRT